MEITGCWECPFKDWPGGEWVYCLADVMSGSSGTYKPDPINLRSPFPGALRPEKCPLPITIDKGSNGG